MTLSISALARGIGLLFTAALLASCSVFNPHLQLPLARQQHYVSCNTFTCSLDYANDWRERYHSAAGDDSLLRNTVALGVIPLSALGLYRGVTSSDHSKNIAALGIGAASLYTAGTYLQSSARQKVYLAGSQAIGCALVAIRPLEVPDTDEKALIAGLDTVDSRLAAFDTIYNTAQSLLQQASQPGKDTLEDLAAATAELAASEAVRTDAQQVWQSGSAFHVAVTQAALTLRTAVDGIRDEVDIRVTDTEPDLPSILNSVGGLSKLAASFEPSANVTAPARVTAATPAVHGVSLHGAPSTDPALVAQLTKARDDLRLAAAQLADASNAVRKFVNSAAANKVTANLTACKVANTDPGFSVTPDSDKQALTAGQTLRFSVTSDSGIPRASRAGSALAGVTLSTELEQGAFVAILTASKDAAAGSMQLVLTDGTGKHQKTVTVTVTAAASAGSGNKPPPAGAGQPQASNVVTYSSDQIKSIQRALNDQKIANPPLPLTGTLGPQTTAAIKSYQTSLNETATGTLTPAQFAKLVPPPAPPAAPAIPAAAGAATAPAPPPPVAAAVPENAGAGCPTGPSSEFEKSLTKEQVTALQKALRLPAEQQSGILDAATRAQIKAFSLQYTETAEQRCLLSPDKQKAILKSG